VIFPLTLRGIGETVAASAAKAIVGEVKPEHRPAAIRADEERPLATEGARPPAERDRGRDAWAVALPYPKPVAQAELMPVADDQEIDDWSVIDPVPLGLPAFEDPMCGIAGLFLKDAKLEPDLGSMLAGMLSPLSDRGPDSAGFAVYGAPKQGQAKLTVQSARPEDDFGGRRRADPFCRCA